MGARLSHNIARERSEHSQQPCEACMDWTTPPSPISTPQKKRTFHDSLLRERPRRQRFDDIYEIVDEIGHGGLCQIYKIRKRDEKVGGSSRPRLRRRKMLSLDYRYAQKEFFRRPFPGLHEEVAPPQHSLEYALKVINLKLVKGGSEKINQLKNEVELLKSLDHRSIIKAYETIHMRDSKQLAIVMELCTGGDLYTRMPYTERQAASVMKQVLSALVYLHDRNIIHRDIKMENIMFESHHPEAAVKLIDFGLSKEYSIGESVLKERVGTLYSMAPGTMKGHYSFPADLWSIGVCTYIMLCAEKPFEGKTPKQLVAKVLLGKYTFDPDLWDPISDDAKDFIKKLLVVKSEDRMTAKQAIRHQWLTEALRKDPSDQGFDEELKQRVREGIIRYAALGEFRKLALNVIAKKSTADEIFELRRVFDEFDTLQTGTITLEEFQEVLAKFNYPESDLIEIFRKVDINRNNVINYTEFLAAAIETQGAIAEYRLAEAFDLMDTDDSGYISRNNLREILGEHADESYIDILLSEADFERDGRISYEEFLRVFSEHTHDRVYDMYEKSAELAPASPSPPHVDEVLKDHGLTPVSRRFRFVRRKASVSMPQLTFS